MVVQADSRCCAASEPKYGKYNKIIPKTSFIQIECFDISSPWFLFLFLRPSPLSYSFVQSTLCVVCIGMFSTREREIPSISYAAGGTERTKVQRQEEVVKDMRNCLMPAQETNVQDPVRGFVSSSSTFSQMEASRR